MGLELDQAEMREYLIRLAKQRRTCGYKELAEDLAGKGSYANGHRDSTYVGKLGGKISEDEHDAGRPLLSVLIFNQTTHLPGEGFFDLAHRLRLFGGDVANEIDQKAYTKIELTRVYDYWSTQLDADDLHELAIRNTEFDLSKTPEEKERVVKLIERGVVGEKVKALNGYKCQMCEALGLHPFSFLKKNSNVPYVEAHHVVHVATLAAGVLSASNIITLCANHHREMHFGNIELDKGQSTDDRFVFEVGENFVKLSRLKSPL